MPSDAEKIVRKMFESIEIMKHGTFLKHDIEFIKAGLEKMLEKTEKVLKSYEK